MILKNKEQLEQNKNELLQAGEFALDFAKKLGADAEISLTKLEGFGVSTRLGEIENIEFNNDGAMGICVYHNGKKGNSSTSDFSEESIIKAVESAFDIAKYTCVDKYAGLCDSRYLAKNPADLDLFHHCNMSIDEAIEITLECESSAFNVSDRIVNSDGAAFNAHSGIRIYGNTNNFLEGELSSRYSLSTQVIAEDNGNFSQDYGYSIARDFNDLESLQRVGIKAAQGAIASLNPQKIITQQAPVIFINEIASGLIAHLAGAISGGALYRKASFLLHRKDTQILPNWFEILERPHLLKALASSSFDSEGVATKNLDIVTNGILNSYLTTGYSARKLGLEPTGHSGGIHNWLVTPNLNGDLTDLMKKMGTGLLVTGMMGSAINNLTGEYSRGCYGFWVENGEIAYPVNEITIAGNLLEMYQQILWVSNDIEKQSNIQTGSILIENIHISGA